MRVSVCLLVTTSITKNRIFYNGIDDFFPYNPLTVSLVPAITQIFPLCLILSRLMSTAPYLQILFFHFPLAPTTLFWHIMYVICVNKLKNNFQYQRYSQCK